MDVRLRNLLLISVLLIFPVSVLAKDGHTEITMTATQAMQLAGALVDAGDFEHAEQILTITPNMGNVALEVERWFLLGQVAQKQGDWDTAIDIYRQILDAQPDLARVRFELAVCYMHKKLWARADYHLRLAMAGKDLPDDAKSVMNYFRYVVRQNKNWNVWFNFGVAPDNNVNNASGGTEVINHIFGKFYRELDEPEQAIGTNLTLGGNYEFKLSNQWRWKSEANIYSNIYDKSEYDDLYLSFSTGPRFVWERGDVWLAPMVTRRWYGWERYNWSAGARLDTNYDFTRRLSGGLYLRTSRNDYDLYGDFLNGYTYSANLRLSYSFSASVYMNLYTGVSREDTVRPEYAYWQPSVSIGLGAELPWGFHVYLEPSLYWNYYDAARYVVADGDFTQVTERSSTQRYSVSVSNNKLDFWGFVPTLMVSYTKRDSNIWQREFDKMAIEFTMRQRF